MKRIIPDGKQIKNLRLNSERVATQKELAHEIRVSERTLRQIENKDAPIGVDVLDRLAKWFGVRREQLSKAPSAPTSSTSSQGPGDDLWDFSRDRLVPRHDYDLAYATTDEGTFFKEACRSHDVVCSIDIPLSEETSGYAQELIEILQSLTWEARDCRFDIPATEELMIRRRIKMLLVLLKGNDVWVYQTSFYRRLPERFEPLPEGEYPELKSRLVVAFGPPGEYGEDTIRVPVDYGQPFILRAWKQGEEGSDGKP